MGRLNRLRNDTLGQEVVSSASYGPAGELTAMSYAGVTETRTYNARLQLTQHVVTGFGYLNSHSVEFNAALLMHEVMHNFGLVDSQLLKALGYATTDASGLVTDRLAKDCFGAKK